MGVDPVTAGLNLGDDATKLVTQVDLQKNTPAETAAAIAKEVQAVKDNIIAALEKGDLDEIRRLCA